MGSHIVYIIGTLNRALEILIQTVNKLLMMGRRTVQNMEMNSILVLLDSCLQTFMTYTIAECTLNELLMMDRGTVRNM